MTKREKVLRIKPLSFLGIGPMITSDDGNASQTAR
jgi:hypothetical protein